MAVVFIEGFDHYVAADITKKSWTGRSVNMATGRFAGQCTAFGNGSISHLFPSTYATAISGFAFQTTTFSNGTDFFVFTTSAAANVCRLSVNVSNQIQVRNSGGTVIATGTTTLIANTWYFVEVKCFVNGASGTCEVHLNGAITEIASTVGNFGSTNIGGLTLTTASGPSNSWDDIYVLDTTGSAPRNTFLGDVRVVTIYPDGDGAHTAWTPDSGSPHFSRVNETLADGDTSYVSDSTPGDIDTWTFGNIDAAATVYGIQANLEVRKDDALTRQVAAVTRQAGTDYVGATVTLGSNYVFASEIQNQDPTGSDWTPTTVNADEFGVKEIA